MHWEMMIADILRTLENKLHFENGHNNHFILHKCINMFAKPWLSNFLEYMKKGRYKNKQLATDLGECEGNMWQLSSRSCQIQWLWMWFTGCQLMPIQFPHRSSIIQYCEALAAANRFHQNKWNSDWTILSKCEIQVHLGAGRIGRWLYVIIYPRAADKCP